MHPSSSPETMALHGFTVYPHRPVTAGFRRMLKRLADRGFCDPACTIIKTKIGEDSGITHEGGRYLHSMNPYTGAIRMLMPMYDMMPPEPPFLLAPGPGILLHEYGHHMDRSHTPVGQAIPYSFRWFSQYYTVGITPGHSFRWHEDPAMNEAVQAASVWSIVAGELWADLFVEWFDGARKDRSDICQAENLRYLAERGGELTIELSPGTTSERIRRETFALFELGLDAEVPALEARAGFLGKQTEAAVELMEATLQRMLRGEDNLE